MWLTTVKAGSPHSNTSTSTAVLPRQGLPSQGLSLTLADSLTAVERSLLTKPSQRPSQPNHPSLSQSRLSVIVSKPMSQVRHLSNYVAQLVESVWSRRYHPLSSLTCP